MGDNQGHPNHSFISIFPLYSISTEENGEKFRATSFPVPCTSRVQCMAGELLARLPTLAGRDQKEATFVEEGKSVIYQRLYLYALVAAYGHRSHKRSRRRRRPANLRGSRQWPRVPGAVDSRYSSNNSDLGEAGADEGIN